MKILILGHKGYLGSFLNYQLSNHYCIDTIPSCGNYSFIINCIGKPDVEFCEQNPEISQESNLDVVYKIIDMYPNSKIIHFSTYYVYDDEGFCTEISNVTNRYYYMNHKLKSELVVVNNGGTCFRLGKLFGQNKLKKQPKLTEFILSNKEITLDNVQFNPTSLNQVLIAVRFELENKSLLGLFNLSNDGYTSHFGYGQYINQLLNNSKSIKQTDKIDRCFHNYGRFLMSTKKISKYMSLTGWQDDLYNYIEEVKGGLC